MLPFILFVHVHRLEDETKDDVYVYPDHLMIIYFRYKTSKKRITWWHLKFNYTTLYTRGYRTIQALGPLLIINQEGACVADLLYIYV